MKQLLLVILTFTSTLYSINQVHAQCITAIQLDGTDDYLHSSFADYDFTNFTIEMWINSPDFSLNDMYVNWNKDSRVVLGGWQADGSINGGAAGLSPSSINSGAGTTPTVNSWHHVAYVYDGTNQIIYIGGIAVATIPTTGSVTIGSGFTEGLVIGARYNLGQQYTNTAFEDVRIWNVARSASELSANAATNLTGNEPGLVAYYRFEDGIGSSTVTDLTGNGNTLTLNNMDPATDWIPGLFSQPSQGTDVVSNCGPYTWIDGTTYTTDNNTATHTIVGGASGGCDSIVSLDLTINVPIDNTVSVSQNIITSNENSAGTQYQWIDCDNNNNIIVGETNQTFTASSTGNYAVIISGTNGCTDTSECVFIDVAGLDETTLGTELTISPNPSNGLFEIKTSHNIGEVEIRILDMMGRVVRSLKKDISSEKAIKIDISDVNNGVYVISISDMKEVYSSRVIKK